MFSFDMNVKGKAASNLCNIFEAIWATTTTMVGVASIWQKITRCFNVTLVTLMSHAKPLNQDHIVPTQIERKPTRYCGDNKTHKRDVALELS